MLFFYFIYSYHEIEGDFFSYFSVRLDFLDFLLFDRGTIVLVVHTSLTFKNMVLLAKSLTVFILLCWYVCQLHPSSREIVLRFVHLWCFDLNLISFVVHCLNILLLPSNS